MYDSDMQTIMKKYSNKNLTRARIIKIYCKECCCAGDTKSWSDCSFTNCPLWRFRKGRELNIRGNPLNSKRAKNLREMRGNSTQNSIVQQTSDTQQHTEKAGVTAPADIQETLGVQDK